MMRKQPNILREVPSDYGGDAMVLYRDPDGTIKVDVRLVRETLWLSQKQMAELFDKDTDTIGLHIRNIYKETELEKAATTEDFSVVQWEGSRSIRRRVCRGGVGPIKQFEMIRDSGKNAIKKGLRRAFLDRKWPV